MIDTSLLRFVEAASVLLFFLQALRAIFSTLFGIVYDQIFAGTPDAWLGLSVLLVLLALLLPALAPRRPTRNWLPVPAGIAALARIALSVNDAPLRYWSALAVLGAAGLYTAGLLSARRSLAMPSLLAALAADQILRAAGGTYDLSLRPSWLPVQILWAATVIGIGVALARRSAAEDRESGSMDLRSSLALGALVFLETSLLSLPNALARWAHAPYAVFAPLIFILTVLPAIPRVRQEIGHRVANGPILRLSMTAGLGAALMAGYFGRGLVGTIGLVLAVALALGSLVIVLDGRSPRERPSGQMLALAFALLGILNFLNALTFAYPYTAPQLRGMGWAVYLAASLAVMLGAPSQRRVSLSPEESPVRPGTAIAGGLIGLAVIAAGTWKRSPEPLSASGALRLATYNVHYGYDAEWHFNLDAMADAIAQAGVDVVAIQEADAGRMTSYCVDEALYLARRLRMNAAYLPTVEHLTGIAILYKGPKAPTAMAYLTSKQEQTGIIGVQLDAGGRPLHAFGTWIGLANEDTLRQIAEALAFIGDRTPASFAGDFNAKDDEPVAQAVIRAGFQDPFALLGMSPAPFTDPAVNPQARIDYVWVRGLTPTRAWVSDSLASDHRMVAVEVQLPR